MEFEWASKNLSLFSRQKCEIFVRLLPVCFRAGEVMVLVVMVVVVVVVVVVVRAPLVLI